MKKSRSDQAVCDVERGCVLVNETRLPCGQAQSQVRCKEGVDGVADVLNLVLIDQQVTISEG